jgi:hypothetical protein
MVVTVAMKVLTMAEALETVTLEHLVVLEET